METLWDSEELCGLAANPAVPPHLLDDFVARANGRLAYLLAKRDDLSAEQVRVLVDKIPEAGEFAGSLAGVLLARGLVEPADVPQWVDEQLATAVATDPAVPESILRAMAAEADRDTRRELVRNPAIPLDLLTSMAASTHIGPTLLPRIAAASDAELRVLAGSTTMQVRMLVAERADLPADLIELLFADPDAGVAKSLVTNPALTADQLWELANRHGPRLYPRMARNPNCPVELLRHMARDGETVVKVYREIAKHPNADADLLLSFCVHDERARPHAARNPNLPVETILELLGDWTVAGAAAANPSLPERVMAELLSA